MVKALMTADRPRNRPRIFLEGYRVWVPDGKTREGKWSRREKIVAMFMEERDAWWYAENGPHERTRIDGGPR